MKQLDLTIQNETGLHARPAKTFVGLAKQFKSRIRVGHGEKEVNAKSLISVLTLGVRYAGEIRILIEGEDEEEASLALAQAVREGLGEAVAAPAEPQPIVVAADPPHHNENGHNKLSHPGSNGATAPTEPASDEAASDQLTGIGASQGIAIGKLFRLDRATIEIDDAFAGESAENAKLQQALTRAKAEIDALVAQATDLTGSAEAAIFEAHLELLSDPDLLEDVQTSIAAGVSAARAWQTVIEARATELASLDDMLLAARSADLRDVGQRVQLIMSGQQQQTIRWPNEAVILIADDLTPSDTISLDTNRVLGFCTAKGGPNAHAAILARALGLPAIVGMGERLMQLQVGEKAVLDGEAGTLSLRVSAEQIAAAEKRQQALADQRSADRAAAMELAITRDGRRIEVAANVGSLADAELAMQSGAEGVGLLRTEFLFLEREAAPTEAEQHAVYRDIVATLQGQPVIIRTLDVGGDKHLPYLDLPAEENPFLGERGIRLCLNRPKLFREQLRAIVRAADAGSLRIMFPMVADLSELLTARGYLMEVCNELNIAMPQVGIMIEVPAAALNADMFAQHVDFFSIGTNDLTQYTLAIDRQHPTLAAQADGLHPAVLRLIARTVEAARAAGKWVGVCGELGADAQAVPILLGLGVDELSVSAPAIPTVKAQIRNLTLSDAQILAQKALACTSAREVRKLV